MYVATVNYNGNPNIGLFCYANDRYCLVPSGFPENLKKEFKKVLGVPLFEMRAAGTDLLGVFFSGNEEILLVPKIMFDTELKELEKFKIKYKVIDSKLTALGNNLLVTKKACIANPDYSERILKGIDKELGIEVVQGKIAKLNIIGSLAKANKKGCIVSPDIEEFEEKFLRDKIKMKITKGTINFGSSYVSSGIVCNSNGYIAGDMSGGPEIQNADEALGFI